MGNVKWLYNQLTKDEFLAVEEVGAWKDRGRPGAFEPYAVLMHHTGAKSTTENPAPSQQTVIDGRPDLAGPLCHVLIGRDGICRLIAGGRANHAGAAAASGPMPATNDGNALYVGIEVDYAPQANYFQGPSLKQYQASWQAAAAIVVRFDKGPRWVRYHAETSLTGKWDPAPPQDTLKPPFPGPKKFRTKVTWWIDNYWTPTAAGGTPGVTPDDNPD